MTDLASTSLIAVAAYAIFLLVLLIINLLYFFQVFKYRLPGDASVFILMIHLALLITTLIVTSFYLGGI